MACFYTVFLLVVAVFATRAAQAQAALAVVRLGKRPNARG